MSVPYATRFYGGARQYDIPAYLTDMEIAGGLGKMSAWIVLMLGAIVFNLQTALIITFILAALLMPLIRLIEPLKNK